MSRFSNLEFGRESEGETQEQPVVSDEAYHLAEAQAACERMEFEKALREYAKVLEFNPQNAAAWTGQVRMLIELGEFREANVWASNATERFPREPELLAAKAVALARSGDLQAALAFSDASIAEQANTPYVWLARGDVLLARKESLADFCFQKALALVPHSWFVHWLAARIHYFYQKFALALKLAQQAMALDAGQSAVWFQVGLCQQALGMAVPAHSSFAQAHQLNPRGLAEERALMHPPKITFWARLSGWWYR
jgi:tetratricopeptide (TPR) repeat protein